MKIYAIILALCVLPIVVLAEAYMVDRITDGDTFVLDTGDKVRLVGVDTPESKDPRKPTEYFSAEATAYLDLLISGKQVRLEYDDEHTDKYGRLLCYVWVDDTVLVNREIVKYGYGMAYLQYPHKLESEFLDLELKARRDGRGMWGSPRGGGHQADTLTDSMAQCESAPTATPSRNKLPPAIQVNKKTDVTVYVTRTGSKYHRGSCQYLRKSKIPMSKADAIAAGYGACSKCRP